MKKIVVTEFVSLNGVISEPQNWSFPFWGDDIGAYKTEELEATESMLLGRVTYDGFAASWPQRSIRKSPTDDDAPYAFADRFNNLPKYVVSTTLETPEWNNSTVIHGDVAAEIAKLKEGDGGNIVVHGSATLVDLLRRHNLVDEYRIMVFPVAVTEGKRLFEIPGASTAMKLTGTKQFASGVILLTYSPTES